MICRNTRAPVKEQQPVTNSHQLRSQHTNITTPQIYKHQDVQFHYNTKTCSFRINNISFITSAVQPVSTRFHNVSLNTTDNTHKQNIS